MRRLPLAATTLVMTDSKATKGSNDWSRLLTDPDLVAHIGQLLQAYRDAPPDRREHALLEAMHHIKRQAGEPKPAAASEAKPAAAGAAAAVARAPEPEPQPPFQPDIFTPSHGQDRRRYPRIKCFVAVELREEGAAAPVWGNLSNASAGGCYIETLAPLQNGLKLEIGLWVNNGKIWVKGIVINGVVIQSNPCFGIRIKYTDMDPSERETLRFFLKFVEGTTKSYDQQNGYLAKLKR
jgi:hypothetical protein